MSAYPFPGSDGPECTLEQWKNHRSAQATLASLMPEKERDAFLRNTWKNSAESLAGWEVPTWALQIRDFCTRRFHDFSPPGPEMGFHCDIALIGLYIVYPNPEDRAEAYRRVVPRFLSGALRPVVDSEEATKDPGIPHDLEGYRRICELCASATLCRNSQRWLAILSLNIPRLSSRTRAAVLADHFIRFVCHLLFDIDEPDFWRSIGPDLFWLYADYSEIGLPGYLIAQAFPDALEAECSPPGWLMS